MLALLVALAFGMVDQPEPAPAQFKATLKKEKEDRFEATGRNGATWKITSKSGIGAATVELKSGKMPEKIVIRFAGMRSLEGFKLSAGGVALEAPAWRDANRTKYFDRKGKVVKGAKGSAGSLTIETKGNDVEVTLVNPFPSTRWSLSWVDAYRR
jgi:hypothetical protein